MLFYKIEPQYWEYLKSFLVFLDRLPSWPPSELDQIETNINILNELKGL